MSTETIDMTPTWQGILPLLLAAVENGTTAETRNNAMTELRRMAQIADDYVAAQKVDTGAKKLTVVKT